MKKGLILGLILASVTWVLAQTFAQQGISFRLEDKAGNTLTDAAITSGQIKVYSLREVNAAKDQQLTFNSESKNFSFKEAVISPGISLAFVSPTDTMFITVYGRSGVGRVIDGLQIQRGSYVLTSGEFSGNPKFKPESWNDYLEDETPASEQDLTAYIHQLKDKKPVTFVQGSGK